MTIDEFSNEFDVLVNSYINKIPSNPELLHFDEYEKSIFLTHAQEEIVIDIYNGKNIYRDSFEETEEVRRYLDTLIKTCKIIDRQQGYTGLSNSSVFFKLPEDLLFITYESVNLKDTTLGCLKGDNISVIPTTQDEYHRIKHNPFRNSNDKRVLRFDIEDDVVELISKYNIEYYLIRYIKKPQPIILVNLSNDLTIDNQHTKTIKCELNSALHGLILERAVQLALQSRNINAENK